MSGKALAPESIDRASDQLTDFSASRLGVASKCGLAFEYQYVRKLPAPYETGAQMFGNAIHDGTQAWYELPDEGFKQQDLAPIVAAQWEKLLPPVIWENVLELRELSEETAAIAAAILFKRPELKSPTTTQEYIKAEAVVRFSEKKAAMVERCDALAEVKWPKDEDPYKAYVKSTAIAAQMQARWQPLPRPIAVEYPFAIEVGEFRVRGRIDQVRIDPSAKTGEANPRMVDIKTGRNAMTQMEAFLQSYLYYEAIMQAPDLPDTDDIAFYLARMDKYQQGRIDRGRHRALALRILNGRARQIIMGQFEPSYGFWCKRCDFHDLCESEISIWQGDGIVAELIDR